MRAALLVLALVALLGAASFSSAGEPSPATSDCDIAIVQGECPRPACLAADPPVLRLCPAGDFDRATFQLVVRDAAGAPCPGVAIKVAELAPTVRIASGGSSTDLTDASGVASVELGRASGYGRVGVCAEGVVLCEVEVISFDVATGTTPMGCTLPAAGGSIVNVADVTNVACGFLVKFGPVTPGVNAAWDLNCDGRVNAQELNGAICPPCGFCGGWYDHQFHARTLSLGTCP